MLYRSLALFFLLSSSLLGQSIDASKVAAVHVYRQDRLLIAVSVFADGNRVVALTAHKSATTFHLEPSDPILAGANATTGGPAAAKWPATRGIQP